MNRDRRIERILECMKDDNERIWEALTEADAASRIEVCQALRSRSGIELLSAVDKLFTKYWIEQATEQAKDSEFQEQVENRYRRVSAY